MSLPKSEKSSSWSRLVFPSSTLATALVGSVLCWLAFPPVAWAMLVWFAPVPWLLLILQPQLPGKRPYRSLWLAGMVFWLLTVHWIRLPHPLNNLALLTLASYLGLYLPMFVGLSRVAVHRQQIPLWLAAPVVWTGLDWVRNHLMTGFGMGSLAHTQYKHPVVIQIADLCGEYGVTFSIVLLASSLASFLFRLLAAKSQSARPHPLRIASHLVPGVISLVIVIGYGFEHYAVSVAPPEKTTRIALIQGNTLADWKNDPAKQLQIVAEYQQLSQSAVQDSMKRDGKKVDLVIWPETAFRQPLVSVDEGYVPPQDKVHPSYLTAGQSQLAMLAKSLDAALFVGLDRAHISSDEEGQPTYDFFNSSALVDPQGKILGTYDKIHRVPFGEYIPFSEWIPAVYELTPLTGSTSAGRGPAVDLQLGDVLLAPNICYETAVPHLIRQQVNNASDGKAPNVLVNLTNDAWYWGSSELDMHLACGVLRSVEMRTPMVIAANGGLSAHVDRFGSILQVTGRQKTEVLLVDLPVRSNLSKPTSFYAAYGDWFAILCVLCCMVLAVLGRVSNRQLSNRALRGNAAE